MSHLENLLHEYYLWQGYTVCRNIKVGRLAHGGYEGELDIVAYHPGTKHLIHLEPSIDGHSWSTRESRYLKKFQSGKKYIFKDVFPWLDPNTALDQVAILVSCPASRTELAGGKVRTIDQFVQEIRDRVVQEGLMSSRAIPEQFPLLRTIQLVESGYYQKLGGTSTARLQLNKRLQRTRNKVVS
jgi:hypothetical protein